VTREPYFVQSLERGLAVIRAFGAAQPELTLSDVARATGMTRAAARRFLLTLTDLGYIRCDGRMFSLTPRVLELGYSYLSGLGLPQVAMPHLEELSRTVHESTSVSVLDGTDIVYVARVPTTRRIMSVAIDVGTRFPAHATSMGRVLLAGLESAELERRLAAGLLHALTSRTVVDPAALRAELAAVAEQGWAMVDQELEEGLRAVAAPIVDQAGRTVAAVNVSLHAVRCTAASVQRDVLPALLKTAKQISADLV
jgi:IclR family pca regulon transcriptional regulator